MLDVALRWERRTGSCADLQRSLGASWSDLRFSVRQCDWNAQSSEVRLRCSKTGIVSWWMLEFEAEVKSFRVMSTSESPVKVEISGDFIFAERANVLSCCTGMV